MQARSGPSDEGQQFIIFWACGRQVTNGFRHLSVRWPRFARGDGRSRSLRSSSAPTASQSRSLCPSGGADGSRCSVLLYQAGADPHIDDPLGGALTSSQLARRDTIVFDGCRVLGLPIAWNLAGGYQ